MSKQIGINKKLTLIEGEINSLKSMVIKLSQSKKQNKILKLEGTLNGLSVTENDIENAKKSLFKVDA